MSVPNTIAQLAQAASGLSLNDKKAVLDSIVTMVEPYRNSNLREYLLKLSCKLLTTKKQ